MVSTRHSEHDFANHSVWVPRTSNGSILKNYSSFVQAVPDLSRDRCDNDGDNAVFIQIRLGTHHRDIPHLADGEAKELDYPYVVNWHRHPLLFVHQYHAPTPRKAGLLSIRPHDFKHVRNNLPRHRSRQLGRRDTSSMQRCLRIGMPIGRPENWHGYFNHNFCSTKHR